MSPVDDAGEPAVAPVGGVCDADRRGDGREERLEPTVGLAGFGEFVERLFGGDDLLARVVFRFQPPGAVADLGAELHQLAALVHLVDHLRIVARGERADRGTGEAGQIGRTAQFLQPLVIGEEGLQRDRRGQHVGRDPLLGERVDAFMHRFVEMRRLDDLRDPVVDLVVGQDRAEELLLGFDVVRHAGLGGVFALLCILPKLRDLVHAVPSLMWG